MTYNINTFTALQQVVNTYLEEQGFSHMFSDELKTVIDHLRGDPKITALKITAIKFVREVTKKSQPALFTLDSRTRHDAEFNVEPHFAADMHSEFTKWALEKQVDLRMGENNVEFLSLKKTKDLVEFIQLNLRHLAG